MANEYAKYLRKFPQVTSCEVMLRRSPRIEEMAKAFVLPIRKSARILIKNEAETNKEPMPFKAIVNTPRRKRQTENYHAGKSTNKPAIASPILPKSILIGKSRMRQRSKSVAFDPKILTPSPIKTNVPHAKRNLLGNGSIGSGEVRAVAGNSHLAKARRASLHETMTTRSPSNHQAPACDENVPDATNYEDVTTSADGPADSGLSSGEVLAYENRISNLITSNQNKIHRIKELMADHKAISDQNDSLHRMNRVLCAAADRYREEIQKYSTQGKEA